MFLVDRFRPEADHNRDDEGNAEEEDGEVKVVEVFDHFRSVVLDAFVAKWRRKGKLQNKASSANNQTYDQCPESPLSNKHNAKI